jgi:hypothetical protein
VCAAEWRNNQNSEKRTTVRVVATLHVGGCTMVTCEQLRVKLLCEDGFLLPATLLPEHMHHRL